MRQAYDGSLRPWQDLRPAAIATTGASQVTPIQIAPCF
jgi:hypothetical protein